MYVNNMNQLVSDASTITISKKKLDCWKKEYLDEIRRTSPEVLEAEAVKEENRNIVKKYKGLERNYEALNREHVDLVNKYLEEKAKYEGEHERVQDLQEQVKSLKDILSFDRKVAEDQVKVEMHELAQKNIQLTQINIMMEDTAADLERKLLAARNLIVQANNEKEDLRVKLNRLTKSRVF
jgi:hypothetical protein